MEEREKIIRLFDIYKKLLTDKQRECFQCYYFEDLSLNEIGENLGVSKAFIGKTLKTIICKLNEYEGALSIYKIYKGLERIKDSTNDENTKREIEELL